MEVNQISRDAVVDIFNTAQQQQQTSQPSDGFNRIEQDADIFDGKTELQKQQQNSEQIPLVDTPPNSNTNGDEPKLDENGNPIDGDSTNDDGIFVHDEDKKKAGRKPKYNFEDTSGYFEDRIKNGKFVPIEEQNDKGEVINFIPKTPEEFDEFIELQISHKLSEKEKAVDEGWYTSKSPAWQTVAKYSELVDDPSEILPFIQGVQNIESISALDAANEKDAEKIMRVKMQQSGDTEELIESQINALKQSNILVQTADKTKPLLIQREQQVLANMQAQKQIEMQNYLNTTNEFRTKAIEAIEKPIYGKQTLKKEEKAVVYDLIAEPNEQLGGYAIYSVIDKLYETSNFELLAKMALMAVNELAYNDYIAKGVANTTAEGLQRKLRVATQSTFSPGRSGDSDLQQPQQETIKRQPTNINQGFRRL